MNISFDWLRDYVDIQLAPRALADRLTMAGLPVDELRQVGDDFCLAIDITANRPDCLGHLGVAREVSALTGAQFKLPDVDIPTEGEPAEKLFQLDVVDKDLCPRYTGRVLSSVKIGPSPDWMIKRLQTIGVIPPGQPGINNIVDITNYVLMECSQPLHAFDYELLHGHRIVVRRAKAGEPMDLLVGAKLKLEDWMLVIADESRPVALAGIMGGLDSMIQPKTSRVLLESASFLGRLIRRTSRKLGVATDSSYRFERTVDIVGVDWASRRAAALMVKHAGAKLHPGVRDSNPEPFEHRAVSMRKARAKMLLGVDIPDAIYREGFKALGLDVLKSDGQTVDVRVPCFRPDLTREVDLIEEAARLRGFDAVPEKTRLTVTCPEPNRLWDAREAAGLVLTALGFDEVMTDSFAGDAPAKDFHPWKRDAVVAITEASRKYGHQTVLQDALCPMVLLAKQHNQNAGAHAVRFFEIATVFLDRPKEQLPEEKTVLALAADDAEGGPDGESLVRGAIETLAQRMRLTPALIFEAAQRPWLEKGRGAAVKLGGKEIGTIGRLSKAESGAYGFKNTPAVAEIDFAAWAEAIGPAPQFRPVPRFPAVTRDVALVVDASVPWARVKEAAAKGDAPLIESMAFLSEFRGGKLGAGKKSIAFRVTYRHAERSLTSEEAQAAHDDLTSRLCGEFKAALRGT
jgi:phenylalanyl-tRNA synthetase beta chain